MEKRMLIVVAIFMMAICGQFAFAKRAVPSTTPASVTVQQQSTRTIEYYWYADEDLTDAVGTHNTMDQELARLRGVFPHHVFSETHYMGLNQFEWGYNPNFMTVVIYSNL